jgi:hypothetical protein
VSEEEEEKQSYKNGEGAVFSSAKMENELKYNEEEKLEEHVENIKGQQYYSNNSGEYEDQYENEQNEHSLRYDDVEEVDQDN